ncbi:MAG: hypothetical protein FD152_2652, partial [Xanthobacteraceae bacterium]
MVGEVPICGVNGVAPSGRVKNGVAAPPGMWRRRRCGSTAMGGRSEWGD